jgi:hypothetical protein
VYGRNEIAGGPHFQSSKERFPGNRHIITVAPILIILCISHSLPSALGNPEGGNEGNGTRGDPSSDDVEFHFFADFDERPTNYSFLGEYNLYFNLIFRMNCSRYNYTIHNAPYLPHFIQTGSNTDGARAGATCCHGQGMNETALPGMYHSSITIFYTPENSTESNVTIAFQHEIIDAIRVTRVEIPDGFDRKLSLSISTNVTFTSLWLAWDSDGDVSVDKTEHTYYDIRPGNHTFSTKISQGVSIPGDQQEVGYHLIAYSGNRSVEIIEKNINVRVTWKTIIASPGVQFSLAATFIVLIALFFRFHAGSKPRDDGD